MELWLWTLLGLGGIFLLLRAQHYFSSRGTETEGHDSYLVVNEVCNEGTLKYKKCPKLEMWGFKFSVIITLLVINLILTISLYSRR